MLFCFTAKKRGGFHHLSLSLCLTMSFATQPFVHHAIERKATDYRTHIAVGIIELVRKSSNDFELLEWRINIFSGWCHANFKRSVHACLRVKCEFYLIFLNLPAQLSGLFISNELIHSAEGNRVKSIGCCWCLTP